MQEALFQSSSAAIVIHGTGGAFALLAALILASSLRMNKGARANVGLGLIAGGFALLGLVEASKTLIQIGLPNLARWEDLLAALGFALVMAGAIHWHRLVAKLLK